MKLNEKIWGGHKKVQARLDTIIAPYRQRTHRQRLPADAQYWTVCGQCTDLNGKPNPESELSQLLSARLLRPNQFHGVDNSAEIIAANQRAYPDVHWHLGDFYRVLYAESGKPDFRPAIINADLINMPDRAASYTVSLMSILAYCSGPVMLLVNVVLEYQRLAARKSDIERFIVRISDDPSLSAVRCCSAWTDPTEYYFYEGTGDDSRTKMGSLIFWKN
jgi:hypothetical protein